MAKALASTPVLLSMADNEPDATTVKVAATMASAMTNTSGGLIKMSKIKHLFLSGPNEYSPHHDR